MGISKLNRLFMVCSTLITMSSVQAADEIDLFNLSLEDLLKSQGSVASNVISDVRKQPVSITTITKDKIALSGARTVNELLTMYVPGYFMVEDQDDSIAAFRGLVADNNSKVMLLLNGQNLNTEWFWGPPDAILNGLDMDYIERIEVIRGPGSVTLGQGALLGVINIVTKSAESTEDQISYSTGAEGLSKKTMILEHVSEQTKAWLYLSDGQFEGNTLDNRGWARNRSDQGLSVYERQHRLHRSDYTNLIANIKYKKIEANIFHFEQSRDLYSFYRDREAVEQQLQGISLQYDDALTESLSMTLSAKYINDEYGLYSHGDTLSAGSRLTFENSGSGFSSVISDPNGIVQSDLTMGGTRETRNTFKALFSYKFTENHKLAFGLERNTFSSGQEDRHGNNFLLNEEIQTLGLSSNGIGGINTTNNLNQSNTWVKPLEFSIDSFFAEDFYSINKNLDVFAAVRYDDHPFLGAQVSPRVGVLYDIDNTHLFRITWQTGFRGAVGVHYAGGFVQDGFLAEENFSAVNALGNAAVDFNGNPIDTLEAVEPETLESIELAYTYTTDKLNFNAVFFLNTAKDIITAEAHEYSGASGLGYGDKIGTDDIGSWGGNFYYQNQEGELSHFGYELEIDYKVGDWVFGASHSHVEVTEADEGTIGVYVLEGEKSTAYPEDVTRLHLNYGANTSIGRVDLSVNDLYYWQYYSPSGVTVTGTHIINAGISLSPNNTPNLKVSLLFKNLTNTNGLYPINGTGNTGGADGTPAIEGETWWMTASYKF